jgi:hypothetical protein
MVTGVTTRTPKPYLFPLPATAQHTQLNPESLQTAIFILISREYGIVRLFVAHKPI